MSDREAEAFAAALINHRKFRPALPSKPSLRLRKLWRSIADQIFPGTPAPNNEAPPSKPLGD